MCEWLSCAEWCDVKLVCGGRAFNAHRAVLASVSTFLRQILLSCTEETPTFIVLPEFDIDAMASVLYYIYNGEVMVPKRKYDMFIDIVTSLRIYIDSQYLSQVSDVNYNKILCQNSFYRGTKMISSFSAESFSGRGPFVKLRKRTIAFNLSNLHSKSELDDRDKRISDDNCRERQSSEIVRCSNEDRQRSALLRDLYKETYPQNGNANGYTGGVLAISNEDYRDTTSMLFTNANGKYPQMTTSKSTSLVRTNFPSWSQVNTQMNTEISSIASIDRSSMKTCNESNFTLCYENFKQYHSDTKLSPVMLPNILNLKTIGLNHPEHCTSVARFDKNYLSLSYDKPEEKLATTSSTNNSKNVIFNQVLESPWCPRKPSNYKPFRRKTQSKQISSQNVKDTENSKCSNDDNNNLETNSENERLDPVIEPTTSNLRSLGQADSEHKCNICDQMFTSSTSLSIHMRRHSMARYICTECSKSFSQLRNYKYHMSVHRGTKEFAATCPVCGKYFNDRGYLSSHMKIHRNRKEYKCSMCPKSFNQRVAYNMHARIHTGIKPHVCGDCGKAFSRKMLLKQHQRTHSGERPYACSYCDKRFADRSNMTLHLRLHTGVKPFSCTLCQKSFTKKHHLKSHLNFHTGAKPYSCPRCHTAFTQSSNMRTHLKKCTVEPVKIDKDGHSKTL